MAVSKAQQKAVHKYVKSNYNRMELTVPKGRKAEVKAHADGRGESINSFVNRAISETMERDTSQKPSESSVRAVNPLEGKNPRTRSKPHRGRQKPQERICPHSWPVLLKGQSGATK